MFNNDNNGDVVVVDDDDANRRGMTIGDEVGRIQRPLTR